MTFTFVHTADWQIGKPFAGFPADKAPLLREARLEVIGRIAGVARTVGARHVLVAGDVYDSRDVSDRDLLQSLERMRRERDIIWHLLPGNHDPAQAGSVWERLMRTGVLDNVRPHLEPKPQNIDEGVALLPAPLKARSMSDDPTAWMDSVPTPNARYRIGLAHGSIQGFGGGEDGEAAVPIAPDRPKRAGLDYLALGDWHGVTPISDRAWYSGTPEPDRFPDNEPGFALVVRLEEQGQPAQVERVATAHFTWWKRALTMTGPEGLSFFEQTAGAVPHPERLLLRLTVNGTASLSTWADAEARLAALEQRLFHLVVDSSGLEVLPEDVELEQFGAGDLRRVAEVLDTVAREGVRDRAQAASLALRKLYALWRDARQGERA